MNKTTKIRLLITFFLVALLCFLKINYLAQDIIYHPTDTVFHSVPSIEPEIISLQANAEHLSLLAQSYLDASTTVDIEDAKLCAMVMHGEARGLNDTEKSAVTWCILNRVDSPRFPNTIYKVVTQPNQFTGYTGHNKYTEDDLRLAVDILTRWEMEKRGVAESGRTLPEDYVFYWGDYRHNHFRKELKSYDYWDWSLESPYGE